MRKMARAHLGALGAGCVRAAEPWWVQGSASEPETGHTPGCAYPALQISTSMGPIAFCAASTAALTCGPEGGWVSAPHTVLVTGAVQTGPFRCQWHAPGTNLRIVRDVCDLAANAAAALELLSQLFKLRRGRLQPARCARHNGHVRLAFHRLCRQSKADSRGSSRDEHMFGFQLHPLLEERHRLARQHTRRKMGWGWIMVQLHQLVTARPPSGWPWSWKLCRGCSRRCSAP